MSGQETWSAVGPAGIRCALWQIDNMVFHAETGETHLLSELPTFLVQTLASHPLRTSALCEHVAKVCGTVDDAAWREKLYAMLTRLEELELVERRPASSA
jgi:PqqD family protein of HPr-rel-A system